MKFNIGRLGVEIILTLNPVESTPVIPGPTVDVKPPVIVIDPKPPVITLPVAPGSPVLPILDRVRRVVYTITSAFEGGPIGKINYTNLSGDFDGQGFSIGFLQWCVGQGSDLPLFDMMLEKYPVQMKAALGKLFDEFVYYMDMTKAVRLSWAKTSVNHKGKIDPVWGAVLTKLCNTPEFQYIQNIFAEKVYNNALKICKEYGLKTMRGVMLAFDIVTQNGSISSTTKATIMAAKAAKERSLGRPLKEKELLEIIAIKRAQASNARWVSDVMARKLAIVNGVGLVHGDRYDLGSMGLTDEILV